MKLIKNKFDKHAITDLPKVTFEGRIITVVSEGEAERAVNYLLSQPILGLDTETKPRFKPGSGMNKVALLQVSTPNTCFLFRLNKMGMPPCIIRLLQDKTITKIGLSWHDDLAQLRRRQNFEPGTFVELQQLVRILGIEDLSLQKIYANLYGQKISKSQRLTNWEHETLTAAQKVYAATDAWACIQIYNEILRLHETQDYELEVIPAPVPPTPVVPKETKPEVKAEEGKPKSYRPKRRKATKAVKSAENKPNTPKEPVVAAAAKAETPAPKAPRKPHKRKPKAEKTESHQ